MWLDFRFYLPIHYNFSFVHVRIFEHISFGPKICSVLSVGYTFFLCISCYFFLFSLHFFLLVVHCFSNEFLLIKVALEMKRITVEKRMNKCKIPVAEKCICMYITYYTIDGHRWVQVKQVVLCVEILK